MKAVRFDPIKMIEESGIGEIVDQYLCEFVCGKGEFGKCRYFKRIYGIPVCIRRSAKGESRLLKD